MTEGWAIGLIERPDTEFQVIRYNDYKTAAMMLARLMAAAGPYTMEDLLSSTLFLVELENTPEEAFDREDESLFHLHLADVMFVIGKFENFKKSSEATFRVVQDHRDCGPDHCFGDIAERN